MRTRYQKGHIYRKGNIWMLRFYDYRVLPDGTIVRLQMAHKLVEYGGNYRSRGAVRPLARDFLARINESRTNPHSTMSLAQFVEERYLAAVEQQKRVSTYHGYRNMWKRYLKPHGAIALRDFRTADGERVLGEVANAHDLTKTTLAHIKAFLSGVFRTAIRLGVLNSPENPMRLVVLPNGRPAGDTYAYSLKEIAQFLSVLPWDAGTVVLTAAFTGVRRGELRGLQIENYDGTTISITQSYWRSHALEPKTKNGRAPVPIITALATRLNHHLEMMGNSASGLMFRGTNGRAINLDALVRDVIKPALRRCAICHRTEHNHRDADHAFEQDKSLPSWHGWHAFRRGLATNLRRLGVKDEVIQRILRHSNVAVTQKHYIKTLDQDVVAAMRLLERSVENAPYVHLVEPKDSRVM